MLKSQQDYFDERSVEIVVIKLWKDVWQIIHTIQRLHGDKGNLQDPSLPAIHPRTRGQYDYFTFFFFPLACFPAYRSEQHVYHSSHLIVYKRSNAVDTSHLTGSSAFQHIRWSPSSHQTMYSSPHSQPRLQQQTEQKYCQVWNLCCQREKFNHFCISWYPKFF